MSANLDEQQLAREAYNLFEEWFAKPYRQNARVGPVGPMNGTQEQQARALLAHEYLERRGLTVKARSSRFFRISDHGKDLAFRDDEVRRCLGLASTPSNPGEVMAPNTIRLRAKELFEKQFLVGSRGLNIIPESPLEVEACEYLARKGLVIKGRAGSFMLGEVGDAVRMAEADLEEVLGLTSPPPSPPATSTTTNIFNGPVGAVAAAHGAVAHGTVNIQAVDDALHQLVNRQNELGDLTNPLFLLLRAARAKESERLSEEELLASMAETEELVAFSKAVKTGAPDGALAAVKAVLSGVDALKPLLGLLG